MSASGNSQIGIMMHSLISAEAPKTREGSACRQDMKCFAFVGISGITAMVSG